MTATVINEHYYYYYYYYYYYSSIYYNICYVGSLTWQHNNIRVWMS